MSNLLSCRGVEKWFGTRRLFEGLGLTIASGDRIGLIGPNGAGKTTFLKILAGLEPLDQGEVAITRDVHLAYLPQVDVFPEGATVLDVVQAAARGDDPSTAAQIALGKAGFSDPDQKVDVLSGGWRKRLGVASVLVQEPDVVLLDEPTNHLDLDGVEWLEGILARAHFACCVVTHDRFFLEQVTTRIVEIAPHYPGGSLQIPGRYSVFLERRAALFETQLAQESRLANKVRREVEWLKRGVRGRGTKKKDRIDAAHSLMGDLADVSARNRAQGKQGTAELAFSGSGRKTRALLRADGLCVSRGDNELIRGLDLELQPGMRVGLVGPNGSGKSSLLAAFCEELAPSGGTLKRAKLLQTVIFHQDRDRLDPETTLQRALCPEGDSITFQGKPIHVRAWAERFGFDRDRLKMLVGGLSGGERARVLIAELVRQPADLLLLDEPTNDLDLPTRELLEERLREFKGGLVIVTHDRWLLSEVCTELLALGGDGEWRLLADLDQWKRYRRERKKAASGGGGGKTPKGEVAAPAPGPKRSKKKFSNKQRREWEGMEAAIEAAEGEVERLTEVTNDPVISADHTKLQAVCEELSSAEGEVERLYSRWGDLEKLQQG
ncbi:MAG: ABC-F family ATP-binding cassette domain-containing protein [Planctomycetes bacterium]|nr:ABC-F family ATP-binding cassette domain-containing protein [Planctomycetota bacterium]